MRMPVLTVGSWSNISLSLASSPVHIKTNSPARRPRPQLLPPLPLPSNNSPTIAAPVPRRPLNLPHLSLSTATSASPTRSTTLLTSHTGLDQIRLLRAIMTTTLGPFQTRRNHQRDGKGTPKITILSSRVHHKLNLLYIVAPSTTRTDTHTHTITIMPYVTPTSPVGTINSIPFSIVRHSFTPSAIHNINNTSSGSSSATPTNPSPLPTALTFNYESNTSLDALPSVPRRKSNFRPKMVTPASYSGAPSANAAAGASLDKLFHTAPPPSAPVSNGIITVQPPTPDKRIQDEQESLVSTRR
ncbi:hypothetical protein FRC01_010435, partial [Tulasnella sp. 417]